MSEAKRDTSIQEALNKKAQQKKMMRSVIPYFGLVFVFALFSIVCRNDAGQSTFLDIGNFQNLINQCFSNVLVVAGACFIYATGAMDMSVGAVVSMTMFTGAVCLRAGMPWPAALIGAIIAGMAIESLEALVFQYLKVPVFIVTLCVMYLLQGVLSALVQTDFTIDYNATSWLGNSAAIKGIVLLVVLGLSYFMFHKTKFGPKLKAIGANRETAVQGGIRVVLVTTLGFAVLGATCGVAGFFSLCRMGYTTASSGSGIMLNVMIAMVLGGNPLTGGSSFKLINAILGALIVTILTNGLTLMGMVPALVETFKGVLYLIIVLITYDKSKGVLIS